MPLAGHNAEGGFACQQGQCFLAQVGEAGQGGELVLQTAAKGGHGLGRALHFHAHAVGGIAHAAREPLFVGQTIDKGAKTHALHLPAGYKGPPFQGLFAHRGSITQGERPVMRRQRGLCAPADRNGRYAGAMAGMSVPPRRSKNGASVARRFRTWPKVWLQLEQAWFFADQTFGNAATVNNIRACSHLLTQAFHLVGAHVGCALGRAAGFGQEQGVL